jgi:hypothetical protein
VAEVFGGDGAVRPGPVQSVSHTTSFGKGCRLEQLAAEVAVAHFDRPISASDRRLRNEHEGDESRRTDGTRNG